MGTAGSKINLNEEIGRLKQKFAALTDDGLLFEEGKKEEMLGKHQVRLDQTGDDLDKIISSL